MSILVSILQLIAWGYQKYQYTDLCSAAILNPKKLITIGQCATDVYEGYESASPYNQPYFQVNVGPIKNPLGSNKFYIEYVQLLRNDFKEVDIPNMAIIDVSSFLLQI